MNVNCVENHFSALYFIDLSVWVFETEIWSSRGPCVFSFCVFSAQVLPKMCHKFGPLMLVKVVCEASKHSAAVSHTGHGGLRQKRLKKLLLSITARTRVTFAPLVYDFPVFFPGMHEAFHWTPLATCAGKETAVVWLKPGESMCCVCALEMTSHIPWRRRGNSERAGERWGGELTHCKSSIMFCVRSYLIRRDLWGKISEGKKPWCSQYCLFISHMKCNSVSACSSDSLKWVTGFMFKMIFIFSGIIGWTNTLNAKSLFLFVIVILD